MQELADLSNMVSQLKATSSTNDKKIIIAKYPNAKKLLHYTFNTFKQYYVSSDNILKSWKTASATIGPSLFGAIQSYRSSSVQSNSSNTPKQYYADLYQLLDALDARVLTGQKAITEIISFINRTSNIAYKDLILDIIDRDLKCRVSSTIINKVWPGLIPEFDVALANSYWDNEDRVDFEKDTWYASRKLDGCVSGSTLVDIEGIGPVSIKRVVESQIQGKVKSYNHKTKKTEYCEILGWSKNGAFQDPIRDSKWYEIVLYSGRSIKATGNHPIFTITPREKDEYSRVDNLLPDDEVLQICRQRDLVDITKHTIPISHAQESESLRHLSRIKEIKKIHSEDRYDITVAKNENFFANGILVHNCRLLTIVDDKGDIKTMSRNGKEFSTLTRLKEEIKELWSTLRNTVFDGEICIVDDEGNEHFEQIIRLVTRKDYTIPFPKYRVFDILTLKEFLARESIDKLSIRQQRWPALTASASRETSMLVPLEQIQVKSRAQLDSMFKDANDSNWEGLILRKDTSYQGKRSTDLLKVKAFHDAEYVITRMGTGPFSIVKDGAEHSEIMMTQVYFNHTWKNENDEICTTEVGVGSGFTIDQRREFYAHPEKIVGKTVTIKFFEETTDRDGNHSLRFPTIKHIYEDDRNA